VIEVRYREDLLLFSNWFKELLRKHFGGQFGFHLEFKPPVKVSTHVRTVHNMEVDVVVTNGSKTIGIELKEVDHDKAIRQAVKRRREFDYFYIVLDLSVSTILSVLRNHPEALKEGIGFISAQDNCIVIQSYKIHKREGKRYLEILRFIENKQQD